MKKFLFFISLFLFIPFKINAAGSVNISCGPTSVVEGKVITCTVSGNSGTDAKITSLQANLEYNNGLDFVSVESKVSAKPNYSSGTGFKVTASGEITSGNLAIVKFKVKTGASAGTAKIWLRKVAMTLSDGTVINTEASNSITIKSINNKLSSIQLSSGKLSPSFSKDVQNYDVEVNTSSVIIKASLADSRSKFVAGYGPRTVKLGVGKNRILLKVQNENGAIRVYVLNITRKGQTTSSTTNKTTTENNEKANEKNNANKINTLNDLKLTDIAISPDFDPETLEYTAVTDKDSVDIEASLTDDSSSFVEGFGPRNVKLEADKNEILIRVKSESGDIKTYKITVTKNKLSGLSSLTVSEGSLTFQEGVTDYNLVLSNDIKEITINATLANENDKFVDGYGPGIVKLNDGDNVVQIKTVSSDGKETTYTLNITRGEEIYSNNNYLSKLSIGGYDIIFDKTKLDYIVNIKKEKSLNIEAIAEDENAKVEISNNKDLKDGSIIEIKVTAENGEEKIYTITVNKQKDNMLIYLIAIFGGLIFLIIILLLIIRRRKKKKIPKEDISDEQMDAIQPLESIPDQQMENTNPVQEISEVVENQNVQVQEVNQNPQQNIQNQTIDIFNMDDVIDTNNTNGEVSEIKIEDVNSTSQEIPEVKIETPNPTDQEIPEVKIETQNQEPSNVNIENNKEENQNNTNQDDQKVCPHCGTINFKNADKCFMCKKDI